MFSRFLTLILQKVFKTEKAAGQIFPQLYLFSLEEEKKVKAEAKFSLILTE